MGLKRAMQLWSLLLLEFLTGAWCGFLEDGKEYVYLAEGYQNAGTMDYNPAAAALAWKARVRMQVAGDTINFRITERQFSQYVGEWSLQKWPWNSNNFVDTPDDGDFSVQYKDGQVVSMVLPKGFTAAQKNLARSMATTWQIKLEDSPYFETDEELLHGSCRVQYTMTGAIITKSVSHMRDCVNRKYRLIDNFRGHRCDGELAMSAWNKGGQRVTGRDHPEPLYSNANTVFVVDRKGGKFQVNKMVSAGAVVAQYFESTGVSHFVHVNRSMTLVNIAASDGTIKPPGARETITDLSYEFSDDAFKWNVNRNLRAKEPFFSSGEYFKENQATLQGAMNKMLEMIYKTFDEHETDQPTIDKLHKYGAGSAMPIMYALDHSSLVSLHKTLKNDANLAKLNMFIELASEAGTTAAAMFIKDSVSAGDFADEALAARALTQVPFNIRRPNVQLVEEFAPLLENQSKDFLKITGPLTLSHLIQRTCAVAGDFTSAEHKQCNEELKDVWAIKYFKKFEDANNDEERFLYVSFLQNLQSTKAMELLTPVASGGYPGVSDALQASALEACLMGTFYTSSTVKLYLPIFMDMRNGHESRVTAIEMLFLYWDLDLNTLSTIMTHMYIESDNEVINYVYSLFEKYANDKRGCMSRKKQDKIKYFLKYMNQMGLHEVNYDFGISKTYSQSYSDETYGYGGWSEFFILGSHESSAPMVLGMHVGSNLFNGYQSNIVGVALRVEGLAKGVLKQIKKMDENVWDLQKLATIFKVMSVDLKPDQQIKVGFKMQLKGVVVSLRTFDSAATEDGGQLKAILNDLKGSSKNQYNLNEQRTFSYGHMIYEQPTESGLPMAYASSLTSLISLEGTYKRGISKGSLFRDLDSNLHISTQSTNLLTFFAPKVHTGFSIVQDKVFNSHFPRRITIGLALAKKKLTFEMSRPEKETPFMILMHSRTAVMAREGSIQGDVDMSPYCPSCPSKYIISKGPAAMKSVVMMNSSSDYLGSSTRSDYFDCEMDLSDASAFGGGVATFLPFNKQPQTPWNMFQMGVRQFRAYFLYFPRVEQCGIFFKASQAEVNPVKKIVITFSLTASKDTKSKKVRQLGQDNMKYLFKMEVSGKGETTTKDRKFTFLLSYKPGSLGIENQLQSQAVWADNNQFGYKAYIICFQMQNKFPGLSAGPMQLDLDTMLDVSGDASLYYGEASSCKAKSNGITKMTFKHSTTDLARQELQDKWYYKKCQEEKATNEWRTRQGEPYTPACWRTIYDANLARKYTWDMNFEKNTPRVMNWLSKAMTLVRAGLLPFWDVDASALEGAITDTPNIKFDFEFKENDQVVDATFITDKGTSKFPDVSLTLPDLTASLRQLKLHSSIAGIVSALPGCMQTSALVSTLDNTTYPYKPTSCWSLVSGHCAPNPTYAVFSKKSTNMPVAMRAYIGGHKLEFLPVDAKNIKITFNDATVPVIKDMSEKKFKKGKTDIFSITRWGPVYTIASSVTALTLNLPNVIIIYDGTFVQVLPAPNVKGQHCGVCGNFDGNKKNDLADKAGKPVDASKMALAWCK